MPSLIVKIECAHIDQGLSELVPGVVKDALEAYYMGSKFEVSELPANQDTVTLVAQAKYALKELGALSEPAEIAALLSALKYRV